ncbi:hypothetical protein EDF68_10352 [Ochrobactrum sp. BH3]|nr:hypothetical protein EDF68_10352 [Ochrobactrum sp. BH3]
MNNYPQAGNAQDRKENQPGSNRELAALPFLTGAKVGEKPYVDCTCTKVQQDEACPVGYPSLLCEICDGKGVVPYVKLDGPELWEIVFGIANEVAHEITDEQYTKIAEAINSVFIDPVTTVSTPSPRAQALEEAAKIAEQYDQTNTLTAPKEIAAEIRAMAGCKSGQSHGLEVAAKWHESEAEYYEAHHGDKDGVPFPIVAGWHRLHAKRIRALSSQPVADGWLPIETAPKDGTVIDLWSSEFGRQPDCFWGKREHHCGEAGQYCDSDWHSEPDAWIDSAQNTQTFDDITHWRPLPASPEVSG